MVFSLLSCRRLIVVCAVLLVAVALVVTVGVIPLVRSDTSPGATPESAVPAFWVAVALHLLVAVMLVFTAVRSRGRGRIPVPGLVVMGIAALLFGIALADAAFAYRSHGPSMSTVSVFLFICVAADSLAGAMTIATAFPLRKRTQEDLTGTC